MAGHGPAPKPDAERRRRNPVPEMAVLSADGLLCGPDLPESLDWPAATSAWWLTWRESAQAKLFTATDWSFLLDTALLHAEFWLGDLGVASELRLRAAKFGATPEDRARLKIEVCVPPAATAPRAQARGRRERLLKAVNDGDDEDLA